MIGSYEASYQQFGGEDSEDTPQESGVVIHVVPDCGKAFRWNHIEDLDSFFIRVYHYHQHHGFVCMTCKEVLELFQFLFVVIFSTFLLHCVDYPALFTKEIKTDPNNVTMEVKRTISDVTLPLDVCVADFGNLTWAVLVIAIIFWILSLIKFIYNLFHWWDVKAFFNTALNIRDNDLDNFTWYDVQQRIRQVQREHHLCIHKKELTELDICQRIVRYKNYMVAMVNKSLLPPKFNIPQIGEFVYFTHGLKYNIELILFWGPWSPFLRSWNLKDEYKRYTKRQELATLLSRHILYVAVGNLLLCPLVLLWQILYSFFYYAEMVKREPSILSYYNWSLYGKYYFRHFNELDHELNARLSRAYAHANKYIEIFNGPLVIIFAKTIFFVASAIFGVLLGLGLYNDNTLHVDNVVPAMTVLAAVAHLARKCIPDENQVKVPEYFMGLILAHAHYIPSHWRGNAHKLTIRNEFGHRFQNKATFLMMELLSPILTPILLITYMRPRALEYIDFFRNFTVNVQGVGDVCSFAEMDIRNHGNPDWNPGPNKPTTNQYTQAEEGKTELSLIHFTLTNPEWTPPGISGGFVANVKQEARKTIMEDPMLQSSLGPLISSTTGMSKFGHHPDPLELIIKNQTNKRSVTNASKVEGPIYDRPHVFGGAMTTSLGNSVFGTEIAYADPVESTAFDMSINTLYLHQAHQREIERRGGVQLPTNVDTANVAGAERLPLLGSPSRLS